MFFFLYNLMYFRPISYFATRRASFSGYLLQSMLFVVETFLDFQAMSKHRTLLFLSGYHSVLNNKIRMKLKQKLKSEK